MWHRWSLCDVSSLLGSFTQIPLLPVGGPIDLRVNLRLLLLLLHHPPGRRGDEELFVDAVSEAVRNTACVGGRDWTSVSRETQICECEIIRFQRCPRTGDGSAYFCGGGLSHLQWRLLAVPGGVRCADQVWGVFQRTLGETGRRKIETKGLRHTDFICYTYLILLVLFSIFLAL